MRLVLLNHDGTPTDLNRLNSLGKMEAARKCRDLIYELGFEGVEHLERAMNPLPGNAPVVSLATLAMTLGVDRKTAKRWLREAGIDSLRLGNGQTSAVYYPREQVQAWMVNYRWQAKQRGQYG